MATVGSFGRKVVFSVSDEKVLTFNNMSRTVRGKWVEHTGIGRAGTSEFISRELETVSMSIVLLASLGVSPLKVIKKIENLCKSGKTEYLVIGNKKVGNGRYYIESVSESWGTIYNNGELVEATLNVNFKEYGN